jgi:hypothetical protein
LKLNAALCASLMLVVCPSLARGDDRIKQATELIMQLCIAGGEQSVEITKSDHSIEVAGKNSSFQIDRRESSGLVGGISKEITSLSAQQASEARSCTQKYLKDLVDIILKDDQLQGPGRARVSSQGSFDTDPETFWGGRGIWEDNQNYCERLLEFLSASATPENFRYKDTGEKVSLINLSALRKIEGNYFVRTEPGSDTAYCAVYDNKTYNALTCSRVVSFGRRDVFASVYNQTLKDMRDCLLPAGWKQTTVDQGACIPSGTTRGECVRRFSKGSRNVWLYSNRDDGPKYSVGIQTKLGD